MGKDLCCNFTKTRKICIGVKTALCYILWVAVYVYSLISLISLEDYLCVMPSSNAGKDKTQVVDTTKCEASYAMNLAILQSGFTFFYSITTVVVILLKMALNRSALRHHRINQRLMVQFRLRRSEYLKQNMETLWNEVYHEVHSLHFERSCLLTGLDHRNLLLPQSPVNRFYVNLKDFTFGVSECVRPDGYQTHFQPPYFLLIVQFMKEVLDAVHYLHDRQICHLDLQTKNILVGEFSKNGAICMVKVGGFAFARFVEDNRVSSEDVGLDGFTRPPEYYSPDHKHDLNARKFDSWAIGIMAYELFTGGIMTVESQLKKPLISRFEELLARVNVLDKTYFVSAMDSRWDFQDILIHSDCWSEMIFNVYFDRKFFTRDCWQFVRGLLNFSLFKRLSVEKALNTHLMRNVREKGRKKSCEIFSV